MAAKSGKYACVQKWAGDAATGTGTDILGKEILAWEYTHEATDQTYASCRTDGRTTRLEGSDDITGTITVAYDESAPIRADLAIGDEVVLALFHSKPRSGIAGAFDVIPAKILSISGGADIENGGPMRWTISWGAFYTVANPAPEFDNTAAALA
jgi:hypothetical protein